MQHTSGAVGKFVTGMAAGMVAGAALGTMLAPSGRELKKAAHRAARKVNQAVDHFTDSWTCEAGGRAVKAARPAHVSAGDAQPRPPDLDRLHQKEGRGMGGGVGDQLQPLGLQPMGPQGTQHVAQPLRPVAQGEPPPVFQQPPGGGAQLLQPPCSSIRAGSSPLPLPGGK